MSYACISNLLNLSASLTIKTGGIDEGGFLTILQYFRVLTRYPQKRSWIREASTLIFRNLLEI